MEIAGKSVESLSTRTLVELFQNNNASKSDRDQAFVVLTFKFRKEVLNKCEIICKKFGHGVSTAELIAINTFEAYARKGQFDETKSDKGKNYEQSFLIYLLKIAERELINYYRDIERKKNNPYDGTEHIYFDLPELALEKLDPESIIEFDIVGKVSRAHRAIYLTYTTHQRPNFKMPRKLLENLRMELGDISQNTVNCYLKDVRDEIRRAKEAYRLTLEAKGNGK